MQTMQNSMQLCKTMHTDPNQGTCPCSHPWNYDVEIHTAPIGIDRHIRNTIENSSNETHVPPEGLIIVMIKLDQDMLMVV